ncbi:Ribosomal protein L29 [Artemisia annua]|uniref:Large ribosomal subunit protein uL29c n=1 Tax=Artemisia annua TaxID=35608 RepID=A0A2U1QJD2_ARTAN|nr:Ribosomal protein L29 [Artemisia annua]
MLTMSIASSATPITTIKPKTHFTSSSLTSSSFNGVRIAHVLPPPMKMSSSKRVGHSGGVVMMAKKEEELKEIRAKTTEEINEEIVDLKGELFMLRLQRSARNEFKSSEFRRMRKRVARMLTVKREREIDEGIGKRLSRKLDRQWRKSIVPRPPPSLKKLQEEEAAEEAKEAASA